MTRRRSERGKLVSYKTTKCTNKDIVSNTGSLHQMIILRNKFSTCTKVPFVAIAVGGLKNNLMDGNKTCCIDHSRWAQEFSASESSSSSISHSVPSSSVQQNLMTHSRPLLTHDPDSLLFFLLLKLIIIWISTKRCKTSISPRSGGFRGWRELSPFWTSPRAGDFHILRTKLTVFF